MKKVESPKHFLERVSRIRRKVLAMSERALDKIIATECIKRLEAYNSSRWFLAQAATTELGVWTRAGELPLRWTNQSLAETGKKVSRALQRKHGFKHRHIRAAHAIPGILKTSVGVLQDEKYLLPIVFQGNTGTRGRRRLKRQTRGDVDDGCMRSVALAASGKKELRIYFGKPR